MAGKNPIIGIKFGVDPQSAGIIKSQLEELASKIKLDVIQVNINESHFIAQLDKLQKELKKKLGEVEINLTTRTATQGKEGGSSGAAVDETSQYKAVRDELFKIYNLKEQIKGQDAGSRKYIELNEQINDSKLKLEEQYKILQEISGADSNRVKQIVELNRQLDAASKKTAGQPMASQTSIAKMALKAQSLSTDNGFDKIIARSEEARVIVSNFQNEVNAVLNQPGGVTKDQIQELNTKFLETQTRLKQIGQQTNTVGNKIKEAFKAHVVQRLAHVLLMAVVRALTQVYKNVVEINTAMTELQIVTSATSKEMEKSFDRVAKSAKKIGANVKDLINSVTVYARLGYELRDAELLAEKTTIYANVAGVNVNEATTNITGIIKAFNIGADGLEAVLDQMIWVGNNFAISQAEIGEAMNNAASSLAANGNTLQEAIAIVTAANTTLQDVSKASTAVRTIAARISASTTELEALGESTEDILATANLDEKMRAFGVAVVDTNGELRSTYDILSDLAKNWDNLASTERAAIAGMVAGTRQQNAFYSIMQNWSDAEKVVAGATDGVGALSDAQAIHLESIEGKVEQLTATWQEFSQNILDSDLIKFFVDLLKVIAEVLNAIIGFGDGAVPKIAMVIASVYALSKAMKAFAKSVGTDFTTIWAKFVAAIKTGATSVKTALMSMIKNPYTYIVILISSLVLFSDKMPGIAGVIVGALLLIGSVVAIVLNAINAQVHAFMASNPLGWILAIITAVVVAITALVKGIISICNSSTQAMEAAVEAAEASKKEWEEAVEDLEEVQSAIDETKDRIAELQALSNDGKITLVQQDELDKLQTTLTQLEAEKELLEDIADAKKNTAEKDAANAVNKILDEKLSDAYVQEDNTFWNSVGRVAASIFSLGISDAFGYGISDWSVKTKSAGDYVKDIFGNWENATEQQRQYATDFYNRLAEQKEMLSYHTGDNLEEWQREANEAYNTYYEYTHRFLLANNNAAAVWDSVLAMERFPNIKENLIDIANAGNVTGESLRSLYDTDAVFKSMIDYLIQLGMFSWDDATKVEGLVNQVNALADSAQVLEKKSFLDILTAIEEKFDTLKDALDDIEEKGIIAAENIAKLLETYPSLQKYFKMTSQGYVLGDAYAGWSKEDILNDFVSSYLQPYVDALAKCEEGTENYTTAQNNLNNAIAVCATLLRTDAVEEATEELEAQKDAIEEQLDAYKELIEIRKDLLESYEEELNYKNELAKKEKAVADLQTQLTLARLDDSAAGRARAREIEEKLATAKEELNEFTLENAVEKLTKQLDDSYTAYEKFIDKEVARLEEAIKRVADSVQVTVTIPDPTTGDTVTTVPEHHSGGFVGNFVKLKNNEEFAKLLRGELVLTPAQMDRFMKETLPSIANSHGGDFFEYNAPIFEIVCDSINKESLPNLETIIKMAVERFEKSMRSALSRTGHKTNFNK